EAIHGWFHRWTNSNNTVISVRKLEWYWQMKLRNEAKVGLIVFAAFLALVAIYWFLGSFSLSTSTYEIYAVFQNVQKLDKGADVRLAGVKIGVVSDVRLTPKSEAQVDMLINNADFIPSDSVARITTGAVIGDGFVEIVSGASKTPLKQGSKVGSMKVVQYDEIISDASALIKELRIATKSISQAMGDKSLIASIKASIKELQETAESASAMMSSAQDVVTKMSPQMNRVFDNLTLATENAVKVSKNIERIISKDAQPNIKAILTQTREATEGLNESIRDAQDMIASFKGGPEKLLATMDKMGATIDQAQKMMTNLTEASASIKELATDQELKTNIKATVKNAADASEQAKTLLGNLTNKFGAKREGPNAEQKTAIPDYGMSTDALYDTTQAKYRSDFNYTFAGLGKSFYRIGLYDLGENTRINLQGGKVIDSFTAFRYGLYASRLGFGFDKTLVPGFRLSADFFRPDHPQMELRGIFSVSGPFGIDVCVKDFFGGSQKDVLVGVHYVK
ncbi:MAG: MlaD family protein, partial [Armatimonadetes bacterium]|nr:MlaD family protein [Armatimonadota bacterium]